MVCRVTCELWTDKTTDVCVIAYLQRNMPPEKFELFTRHNAGYSEWRGSIAQMECFGKINKKESVWSKFCSRDFISTILCFLSSSNFFLKFAITKMEKCRSVTDIINCCPLKRFPIFSLFLKLHFNPSHFVERQDDLEWGQSTSGVRFRSCETQSTF